MSDRFPTQIRIGGAVKREVIPSLIDAINTEGLQDIWGNTLPTIKSEESLLEHVEEGHLIFRDDDRSWGEFPELEEFLVEKKIAFNRYHSPRYETSGELVQFRPGMDAPVSALANDSAVILIEAQDVQRIRDMLRTSDWPEDTVKIMKELDDLCFEADIAPLPVLEIID